MFVEKKQKRWTFNAKEKHLNAMRTERERELKSFVTEALQT